MSVRDKVDEISMRHETHHERVHGREVVMVGMRICCKGIQHSD
jgi:hypothetical protein